MRWYVGGEDIYCERNGTRESPVLPLSSWRERSNALKNELSSQLMLNGLYL
jgi:hypothetical protein